MPKHEPDPNREAARVVARTTGGADELPPDLEAAWEEWSRRIQGCDERTTTLLRAAFEAGFAAVSPATELGRLGASKGGRARADRLSPEERKETARKAAEARWKSRGPKG